jgi:hypothetical protein
MHGFEKYYGVDRRVCDEVKRTSICVTTKLEKFFEKGESVPTN